MSKQITSQTGGEIETFYSAPIIDGVTTVSYGDLAKDAKKVNKMEKEESVFYEIRRLTGVSKFIGSKTSPTAVSEVEILKVLRKIRSSKLFRN